MKKNVVKIALEKTKKYIVLLILLSIIYSYLTLKISMNLKYVIDGILFSDYEMIPEITKNILNYNYMHDLLIFAIIIIVLNFLNMIINYIRDRITTKFKLKININLKSALYNHFLNLEYKSYNNCDKTEIMQRINEDAEVYSNFFDNQFNMILDISFLSIFILQESVSMNIIIAVYIVLTILVMLLFSLWYLKKLNKGTEQLIAKRKELLRDTMLNVNNFKFIRILNKQKEEKKKYKKLNNEVEKEDIKLIKLILFYEILNDHIAYLNSLVIYLIGGIAVIKEKMTLGALSAIISLTSKIFNCFLNLGANLQTIDNFYVVTKKINKFLQLEEEKKENSIYKLDGDIIFSNVSIYVNNIKILKNLNFIIKKGEKTAIIGDNGSGKSIIVKTILGFYDYGGNIYINNHNLKRISKFEIRKNIELILGESYFFSGSILENISLYNQIDMNKIKEVTRDCEIETDINRFRGKYNTLIGEKGIKLSGGQNQRIGLARGLINNKSVIVLDEALNKVDNITRNNILKNLNNKYYDKTIILISNNLEIIDYVDSVIYINEKTSMKGIHKELLKKNKDYRNLISVKENVI